MEMSVTVTYGITNIKSEFINRYAQGPGNLAANEYAPSVIALADGGFALSYVWNQISVPGNFEVLLERYTISGALRPSSNFLGVSYLDAFQSGVTLSDPDSAQLSDGRIVTTWTKAAGTSPGIHFAVVDPVNGNVTSADALLTGTDGNDLISDVAGLRTGGGFVVVKQDNLGVNDQDADILFYNSAGVFQAGGALGGNSGLDEQAPSVAVLTSGNVVVAYEKELVDNTDTFGMAVEIYNSTGGVVLAPFNFDVSGSQNRHPQVLALSTGGFVVAYEDNQYVAAGLSLAFFTAAGGLRSIQRGDPDAFTNDSPNVSELANGYVVVTWGDNGVDVATSLFDPVSMTRVGGSALTRIEDQNGQQELASSAALSNGTFVTAWTDFNAAIADGNTDPDGSHVSIQIDAWARTSTSDSAGDSMVGDGLIDIIFGNAGNDFLYGGNAADQLYGGDGLDYLSGGNDNDYLSGGADKDIFFGGGGVDIMTGGGGDDEYYIGATDLNDIIAELAGGGNDRIFASVSYALGASSEVETIGTDNNSGTGAINLTGSDLANIVIGNNGVNILDGRGGNDIIYGLGGTDYFAFSTAPNGASNIDTIVDFTSVDDIIFLDDAIFASLSPGTVAPVYFRSAAGAVSAAGAERIVHNSTTGDLYYDADGLGGVASVRFANIGAGTAVFNYDFFVY